MLTGFQFSSTDREDLENRGISLEDAREQLALLETPPPPAVLLRACRIGDGITTLEPELWPTLEEAWNSSVRDLRVVKFVPASGAATRMFSFLDEAAATLGNSERALVRKAAENGNAAAALALELAGRRRALPFASALEKLAAKRKLDGAHWDEHPLALGAFIAGSNGLGLADLPKGLIPFHRYGSEARTAFEEHLYEAAGYAVGRDRRVCLHFTVTPGHVALFEEAAQRVTPIAEHSAGVEFEIAFSVQDPSSDTLALAVATAEGEADAPLRSRTGHLVFRPSGHGALIANMSRLDADIVFIKNIDNVAPARSHPEAAAWKKRLGAHLLALRRRNFEVLELLETAKTAAGDRGTAEAVREAISFCRQNLALRLPPSFEAEAPAAQRRFLLDRLDRPLRVCGVVEHVGEPGGGPFWIATSSTASFGHHVETGQIVETSQIDLENARQAEILATASHFNPVDVVCAIRDRLGRPYDLARFTDSGTSFVADKRHGVRPIRALERPGLWNGAMAGWNTAFVEVPLATFTPVKTVLDLARPEHQTAPTSRN